MFNSLTSAYQSGFIKLGSISSYLYQSYFIRQGFLLLDFYSSNFIKLSSILLLFQQVFINQTLSGLTSYLQFTNQGSLTKPS